MRLGIALIALMSFALCSAQQPKVDSQRAEYVRFLADQPVDVKQIPTLLSALEDKDIQVRLAALRAWGKVGNDYVYKFYEENADYENQAIAARTRDAVQELQTSILTKVRPRPADAEQVRLEALKTLCALGDSVSSICPPIGRCGNGIESEFWYQAVKELKAQIPGNRDLIIKLTFDDDPDVVYNAVSALGEDYQKTLQSRGRTWLSHPNKYFRALGIWLFSDQNVWDHVPEPLLKVLIPMLDDPDKDVVATVECHLTFSEAQAMEYSQPAPNRSEKLRIVAIDHLGYQPNEKTDALLRRLLSDSNPKIRAGALDSLFNSERPKELGLLKTMLADPSLEVHKVALQKAGIAGMPEALPYLKQNLISPDRELRETALWSVSHVRGAELFVDEQIRCVELGVEDSYHACLPFGDPHYPDLIERCLNSKYADVRELLCSHYEYKSKGSTRPIDIILRLARDPDPKVAASIISTLGEMPEQAAYDALVEFTSSKEKKVKISALYGLGKTKRPAAIEVVQKLVNDSDRDVRTAAKYALSSLRKSGQ